LGAGILVFLALLLGGSCNYFDPLNPLQRTANPKTEIDWEKVFGSTGEERGMSVEQTSDGGYIMVGYAERGPLGVGNFDIWLIKTDSSGELEWEKFYGGSGNDRAYDVRKTIDGGYIIIGTTGSFGAGGYDIWLIKTDGNGDELWTDFNRTYGGPLNEEGYSVRQTADGGYILAGYTESFVNPSDSSYDAWLVKTDALGTVEWDNHFGGDSTDEANCVQATSDGGYIFCGMTRPASLIPDVYLVKTHADGRQDWSVSFGDSEEMDRAYSVLQTADGGYLLVGRTQTYGAGDWDVWMIKTSASGAIEWHETFGGGKWDEGHCVQPTLDGGYIIAGMSRSGVWEEAVLIKTDSFGQEEWYKSFGGDAVDYANSVRQTTDGGYIMVGASNSYAGGMNLFLVYYKPID
jgi:hypothetical protein